MFPRAAPSSRAFLRQPGPLNGQYGQKNPHSGAVQWICRAVWVRAKPHLGFWDAEEGKPGNKTLKKLETGDFGPVHLLSKVPMQPCVSHAHGPVWFLWFQMVAELLRPFWAVSLQRALQSHEYHKPNTKGTKWPVIFVVMAVWVWHKCGITHIKGTESKFNQHFYSVLQLVLIVLYLWVCWSLEWLRGLAVIATQSALHAEHFMFLCLENFK